MKDPGPEYTQIYQNRQILPIVQQTTCGGRPPGIGIGQHRLRPFSPTT